jgi:hypothetical protein
MILAVEKLMWMDGIGGNQSGFMDTETILDSWDRMAPLNGAMMALEIRPVLNRAAIKEIPKGPGGQPLIDVLTNSDVGYAAAA